MCGMHPERRHTFILTVERMTFVKPKGTACLSDTFLSLSLTNHEFRARDRGVAFQ